MKTRFGRLPIALAFGMVLALLWPSGHRISNVAGAQELGNVIPETHTLANLTASSHWDISVIDSEDDVGYFASIAVDRNDKVHISYIDNTSNYLKYATNASGEWVAFDVTPASLSHTSIVVDSTGKVYIAYSTSGGSVRVAVRDVSGSWTTETVTIYAGTGGLSAAIDEDDVVHLVYIIRLSSPPLPDDYDVKYINNSSGSFVSSENLPTCYTGAITLRSPSVSLDSNGKVYAAFINTGHRAYATNKTGSWSCHSLSGGTSSIYYSNHYSAVDSEGDLHHAQTSGTDFSSLVLDSQDYSHITDFSNNCLRYVTDFSGSSKSSYVDCSSGMIGEYNSIAIDSQDHLHVAYYDRTNGNLKYALGISHALDVVKQPSQVIVNLGQTLTYTIVVTNTGTANTTSTVLTDTLDAWQRPVAATSSAGGCSITDGSWGGTAVCSPGTIVTGSTVVVTLTAQVSATTPAGQVMVNTVVAASNETTSSAQATTYAQSCNARINDDPTEYTTVQAAVDAASPGDLVKVAGYCFEATERGGLRQQVYLDKSLTVQGGYTVDNWTTSDPEANPTTLDAFGQGRVLYITGDITATVEGLRVTGGNADGFGGELWGEDSGGGMYIITATVTISNCEVVSNTASANGDYAYGGGLYLRHSAATLSGNAVQGNTASAMVGYGGGLYLSDGDAILSGNTVEGNIAGSIAGYGGGLCLSGGDFILSGNTVRGNTASIRDEGYGGGLWLGGSDATLDGNIVQGNTASMDDEGYGGGLYLGGSNATLSGNTVQGNTAAIDDEGYGGGLSFYASDAKLINNIISDNQASTAGSGLHIRRSLPVLLHTTIARNTGGDGSGIYVTDAWGQHSAVAMTNTILVSHTVGITVTPGNTATLEATLWGSGAWGNGTDWGGAGTVVTMTDIWENPAFVAPDAGDYHISLGSAARDAGVDAGVTTDIDGDPRPAEHGYDIGADELRVTLQVAKQATPDPAQPGDTLTYTIFITNTGNVTLTAAITDILPAQVSPSGILTWTTSIAAPGGVWTKQFTVTADAGCAGVLANVVQVTTEEGATGAYTNTVSTLPTLDFSSPYYSTSEDDGSATITVTLSAASGKTVTVQYATSDGTATAGNDYTSASGILTFTPGITSRTFPVSIIPDELYEYDETVTLTLSNASNATIGDNNPATLNIEDDESPPTVDFGSTTYSVNEDAGTATIAVTLDPLSALTVTVKYTATGGTATLGEDYAIISGTGTLTFTPGVTSRSFPVSIVDDEIDEGEETIILMLYDPTNATVGGGTAVLTITEEVKVYLPVVLRSYP